jgi:hypothetical protein
MTTKRTMRLAAVAVAALATGLLGVACTAQSASDESSDSSQQLSGAIFTTIKDGTVVNENVHYGSKRDVYLDGGPGPNAPNKAAALPAGDYYFQVTDPSGKTLLSTDSIHCRIIHFNDNGQIDQVKEEAGCTTGAHKSGNDLNDGGLTVQLYPFADTPNPGNEYKAWVTPVGDYAAGEGKNGFVEKFSKTDNFKVQEERKIKVCKVNDKNGNGRQDWGEPFIPHWPIKVWDKNGKDLIEETETGDDGCVTICDLGPDEFLVEEGSRRGWENTGPMEVKVDLRKCDFEKVIFTNKQCAPVD